MRMARNIYRRSDGRFEGRYANGYDANGRTKYSSVFGRTYAEVKDKLERAKATPPLHPNESPPANRSTITEAVVAHLESSRLRLKPSTLGVYKRYVDRYISPHFGNMRCDALTAELSQGLQRKKCFHIISGLNKRVPEQSDAGLRSSSWKPPRRLTAGWLLFL